MPGLILMIVKMLILFFFSLFIFENYWGIVDNREADDALEYVDEGPATLRGGYSDLGEATYLPIV